MPVRSPLSSVTPRALDRDVGAGAHGDADVGGGERRRIVDAVAGHGDDAAFARAAARPPPPCARAAPPPRPRRCRACGATASAVVRLSPVSITTRTPSWRSAASAAGVVALTGSAMAMTPGELAVDRDEDRGRAVAPQPLGLGVERGGVDAQFGQERRIAERDPAALDRADHALAGRRVETLHARELDLRARWRPRRWRRPADARSRARRWPRSAALRSRRSLARPRSRPPWACLRSACRSCRRRACRPSPCARALRRS